MPDSGGDEGLGDLFLRVARELRRHTHAAVAPLGVSPHQSRALRLIGADEPLRPSDLAARLRIAPRSATDVLDSLTTQGFVERAPDPRDRRATLVSLTPAGRDLVAEIHRLRTRQAMDFFADLTPAQREALAGVLDALEKQARHHPG